MSYFDLPRIYFSGTFRAAPSTINNTDSNYAEPPDLDLLWNPNGSHAFQLLTGKESWIPAGATVTPCTIRSVATSTGKIESAAGSDPLIGGLVVSTNAPSVGKLVDLDPDQQQVSQVWGMQLGIGVQGSEWLVGDYQAANFRQLFGGRAPGGFDGGLSAVYQSVLTNLQWPAYPKSPILQALQAANANRLSIRFTVDFLDTNPTLDNGDPNPNFTLGRVAGVIGPATAEEPAQMTVGRMLRKAPRTSAREAAMTVAPEPGQTSRRGAAKETLREAPPPTASREASREAVNRNMNFAPAKVDTKRSVVTIDLGNALPFQDDETPAPAGLLQLAVKTSTGNQVIGTIANTLDNYLNRAFLFDFPLGNHADAVKSNPLVVLSDNTVVMTENPSGAYVDAADYVYRMEANSTAEVTLYATVFGATPPAGQTVTLQVGSMGSGTNQQPLTVTPSTVTIGADGTATFEMSAGVPGNPRGPIDGQVYSVDFNWALDTLPDRSAGVSVHVYDLYAAPPSPSWTNDVQPIFQQFMVLYPYMKSILDLSDENTVKSNASLIAQYMRFPMTNPQFMPVTRDLSAAKTAMILKWLDTQ